MITLTLSELIQKFLADDLYIEKLMQLATAREKTLPAIQSALHEFIQGTISFTQLSGVLGQMKRPWYSEKAPSHAMTEIAKFAKYHAASENEASEQLRALLQDLHASTVGHTIEQCYKFLLQEPTRLHYVGQKKRHPCRPRQQCVHYLTHCDLARSRG